MIVLKSRAEIDTMRAAGRIVFGVLDELKKHVRPGISTWDLDKIAEEYIRAHGAIPSFKGLYGFPATICASISEEIVHGIPSRKRVLADGNVFTADVGAMLDGLHADSAYTYPVGEVSPEATRLLKVTEESLYAGIKEARAGNHIGDIGHAVQSVAEGAGFGVVRELVGHGIGRTFHEEPQVPNYGKPKRGPLLKVGMTIAIEPMITAGDPATRTLDDKWTVVTLDGSLSAHFEHTIAVTEKGPEILTAA
ncbi:MAG TPA: type I methionyl aminopeptidase [Gemmatimonadales bacterium]|nr:type I methionyl aminopeptidase [Gemmatimonadales bacterium]